MTTETYRAAVVGCGDIGHAHMQGYALVDEVEVVAVVDPVEAATRQYMSEYEVGRAYSSFEEMVSQDRPDIVSICTWHRLHPDLTRKAVGSGVQAIICEKPIAIRLGDADRMIEECEGSGVRLIVSHQRRFTPGWEKARGLVSAGAIGTPQRVDCNVGDGLLNCGSHAIDGARFVLGEPQAEWVMGAIERTTNRYERDTPIEDCCMGLVHLKGGAQIFIQSDLNRSQMRAGGFLVRGSEGMIDVKENRMAVLNSTSEGWHEVDLAEGRPPIGGATNAAQVRELLRWIEGADGHRGDARNARAALEIMMSLYESARLHQVIRLPLKEGAYPLELMIEEGTLPTEAEEHDIRGYLKRNDVDEEAFARLRAQGKRHSEIMLALNRLK